MSALCYSGGIFILLITLQNPANFMVKVRNPGLTSTADSVQPGLDGSQSALHLPYILNMEWHLQNQIHATLWPSYVFQVDIAEERWTLVLFQQGQSLWAPVILPPSSQLSHLPLRPCSVLLLLFLMTDQQWAFD